MVEGVFVNGRGPYTFLVNTGASFNHLDPDVAKSIGLTPSFNGELMSSAGITVVPGTSGVEITLDSIRLENQSFLFAGIGAVHQLSPDVQGVLGESFLSQFDYLFDLRNQRIDFGKREPTPKEVRIPFQTVQARPVITTSLGPLVLDSGINWITLFGVDPGVLTHQMTTMTGSLNVGLVSRKLSVGWHAFWHGNVVALPRSAETGAAGLLPISVFKVVYVCNSEGYISLE